MPPGRRVTQHRRMTFTRTLLFAVAGVAAVGILAAGPASATPQPFPAVASPSPIPASTQPFLADGPGPFPQLADQPSPVPAVAFEGGPPTKNVTGREGDPPASFIDPNGDTGD
jgi:hypothetical protein